MLGLPPIFSCTPPRHLLALNPRVPEGGVGQLVRATFIGYVVHGLQPSFHAEHISPTMSHQQPFPGAQPQNWQQYRPAGPQQQAPSFFPLQPPSIATDPSQPLLNPAAPTNGFAPCPPDSSNVQLNLWHQFASGNSTTIPFPSNHLFTGLPAPQAENTTSQPVPDTSTTNLQQPQPIFRAPTASNARSSTMVEKIARNLSEKEDGELSDMDGIQENYSPRPSKRTRLSRSPQSSSRPQPRREQRERQGYDGYRPGRLNGKLLQETFVSTCLIVLLQTVSFVFHHLESNGQVTRQATMYRRLFLQTLFHHRQ